MSSTTTSIKSRVKRTYVTSYDLLVDGYIRCIACKNSKRNIDQLLPNEIIEIVILFLKIVEKDISIKLFKDSMSGHTINIKHGDNIFTWFIGDTIQKTKYSYLVRGIDKQMTQIVALRFIQKRLDSNCKWKKSQQSRVKNEIKALKRIQHQNIIEMIAYDLNYKLNSLDLIFIAYEYAAGGQLFDILHFTETLAPILARTYFHQLVSAIDYLHKNGIIHRNLSPKCLLLDNKYNLKVQFSFFIMLSIH